MGLSSRALDGQAQWQVVAEKLAVEAWRGARSSCLLSGAIVVLEPGMVVVVERLACAARLHRRMTGPHWPPVRLAAAAAVTAAVADGVNSAVAVAVGALRAVQGSMEHDLVVVAELEQVEALRLAVAGLPVALLELRELQLRLLLALLATPKTDKDHEWCGLSAFRRDADGPRQLLSTSPCRSIA